MTVVAHSNRSKLAALSGASAGYQMQVSAQGGGLSEIVLAYEPLVTTYCKEYGISDYVSLVLAIMQQESGGIGNGPM